MMKIHSWLKGRLSIGIMLLVCLAFMPSSVLAADVDVYAEGAYTNTDLVVYIYADINAGPILSFGVKVNYPAADFTLTEATKNEVVWFFGEGAPEYPYMDPVDDGSSVIIIGGKLDSTTGHATDGVNGSRVLLGIVTFTHENFAFGHPIDDPAPITLDLARGGDYDNFVKTDGTVLDAPGIFTGVTIAQRGDADASGMVTNVDMGVVRNIILGRVPGISYRVYADANSDGQITNVDMGAVRNIILGRD